MPNPKQEPDRIQIDKDVNDVFVLGVRRITEFPPSYQTTLVNAYRFSATRFNSDEEVEVNRTPDTLDIV
jgi:hypothetical protein